LPNEYAYVPSHHANTVFTDCTYAEQVLEELAIYCERSLAGIREGKRHGPG